ncbi:type IV secretion protein Rhs [Kocuria massiliensis]|uniref:type IV secretion protein Rhs n=1 Tax=Kocuria massiliensis TaxID=1926282 RepID=UPI001301C435|nr:type IV secretion protein Rhs [Kocuria massiliensis]
MTELLAQHEGQKNTARSGWVIRDNEGGWSAFTLSGQWMGAGSGPGATIAALRDQDGEITRLIHTRGRFIDIEYLEGRVAVARASDGRRLEYLYDENTNLVQVRTEVGTREYRIDEQGLIAAVVAETGVVEVTNTYDQQGRVTGQVSEHGRRIRYGYLPGRVTVVSDEDGGNSNTWIADQRGRVVGIIDTDDNRQSMAYDSFGNRVSVTERDGSITVRGFDERGRMTREVTPEGGDFTYGYDEQDRPTTVVTDSGAVVQYEYQDDVERNPSVIVDPAGGRSELTWEDGLLQQVQDPEGVSVRFGYDSLGDLVSTTNAAGDTARLVRDDAGRVIEAISPSGARTAYEYDALGLLTSRVDADGSRWRFEHGAGGRITAIVDPAGARTEFEYGPSGDLVATVDPLGRRMSRVFDEMGNVESLILPDDSAWSFVHDGLSQVRKIVDPAGGTWLRNYDRNGALTSVTDPTGVTESVDYDRTARFDQVRDAFSSVRTDYDQYGRPKKTTDADGSVELISYDECGRPVELVDAEGGLTKIEYDLAGRTTAITTPGGKTSRFTYDACGRPQTEVEPDGAVTRLVYDADSRVIQRILPSGDVESVIYDVMGRVVEATSAAGTTAKYGYDKVGNLVYVSDGRYGQRRFSYDEAGQLVQAINGLGGKTHFEYDARGRLVRVTDPMGAVSRRVYNEMDQVVELVDPAGRVTTGGYDAAGRQLWQVEPTGQRTEWAFDEAGYEKSVTVDGRLIAESIRNSESRDVVLNDYTCPEAKAVHTLSYDRLGRLIRRDLETQGERTSMAWGYDADGARTFMDTPVGRTTYSYDDAGRVVSVDAPEAGEITLKYDAAGRLVKSVSGAGEQTWEYRDGQMVTHRRVSQEGESSTTQVSYDGAGRVASVDESDGGLTVYSYDEASQLVGSKTSGAERMDRTWVYDVAGRLVRESRDGVEFSYTYDVASQLLSVVGSDGSEASFVYDGLGRRVREVRADGSVREFAWGPTGFVESVATEAADGGSVSAVDVWVDATGEPRWVNGTELLWDSASVVPALAGFGQLSVVVSVAGVAVGDSWSVAGWKPARVTEVSDPWSVPVVGADVAGFLGRDSAVGLTAGGALSLGGLEWMGARVFDRGSRGFLSVDPLDPVVGAGWSGNPYSFAGNDPVGALDPLGLSPMSADELHAYTEARKSPLEKAAGAVGNWWKDNWEYVAAGAAIVGGVALMCTGVGGVAGVALMAGSGALLSGGVSVASQKATNGSVDWKAAGKDALIGGATGAIGGVGMAVAKGATAGMASGGTQLAKAMGVNAGVHGAAGGVGSSFQYLATHGWKIENGRDFAGSVAGGTISSAAGANLGQASGSLVKKFGPSVENSSAFKSLPSSITKKIDLQKSTGNVATSVNTLGSMGAGAGGSVVNDVVSGREINGGNALRSAATSGVSTKVGDKINHIPGVGKYTNQTGVTTLKQMQNFAPRSWNGMTDLSKKNTYTMYGSAISGTTIGLSVDAATTAIIGG